MKRESEINNSQVESDDIQRIIADLRGMISRIPKDSYSVRRVWNEVKSAWEPDFWKHITKHEMEFLRLKVAPLLRFVPEIRPEVEFFTSKVERCGLMLLERKDAGSVIESIKEDVDRLQTKIAQVAAHRKLIERTLSGDFWQKATLAQLDEVRDTLAPLMKYKRELESLVIELGLDDIIDSRKWVIVRKDAERIYVEEYRKKVEEKVKRIAEEHPTVRKIKERAEVGIADLEKLEETLEAELGTDEISLDDENMLKAFGVRAGSFVDFLKHVLKIEEMPSYEAIVRKAFDTFILANNYNADQSRFLRVVQSVFLQRKKLEVADLYEEPFNSFGLNAVDKLFTEGEVGELIELVKRLAA